MKLTPVDPENTTFLYIRHSHNLLVALKITKLRFSEAP